MSNYKFYHPKTGKSFDSAGNAIQVESEVDFVTGANRFVRNDHAYIHEGKAYSIAIKDLNLANDGTKYLQFSTKSEIYNHFKYIQTVDCKVSIYENPDSIDDAGSTQYTPINQNRLSTNTADTTIKYEVSPTLTNATLVKVFQGQYIPDTWEIVLKQNTDYIIEIENIAGAQNNAHLEILWYEEEKGVSN